MRSKPHRNTLLTALPGSALLPLCASALVPAPGNTRALSRASTASSYSPNAGRNFATDVHGGDTQLRRLPFRHQHPQGGPGFDPGTGPHLTDMAHALTRQRRRAGSCLAAVLLALLAAASSGESKGVPTMQDMLAAIRESVADTAEYTGRDALSERVMNAMASVPRHEFVPPDKLHLAYRNSPLPIGSGQTISQPLIVALMTDLLDPQPGQVVLEIGTGSGYQAAVLSGLVKQVYTIEIIEPLASKAAELLARLGYDNVAVRAGDGYAGWPEHAPFDAIIVTAAPDQIPPPLLEQLKAGGKLVIPVGKDGGYQELLLVEKGPDGSIDRRAVLPVRFVPFTGRR